MLSVPPIWTCTILVCTGPGGRAVTFRELDTRACQAAWALKAELAGTEGLRAREPTALLVLPSQMLPALSLWLGLAKLPETASFP